MATELEHVRSIALPSLLGQRLGKLIWGKPYVVYPWIRYMEQRIIEAIRDQHTERYIAIAAPPQTGKSSYVGILLPFWLTGLFPDWPLIYVGYSDDFASARGKDVQALQRAYGSQLFGTAIDPDFKSGTDWRLKGHQGGMLSTGIGGQITGRSGQVILIDDLVKNAEEARSQSTLRKHVDEWDASISTRLQPGGTVILIATRWAEGDLQGVLRDRMADPLYEGPRWEFLEFPAFAEPPEDVDLTEAELAEWHDPIGRQSGEVLDCRFSRIPDRAPEDYFALRRSSMDKYAWTALYQQHPSVREGSMFPKASWKFEGMAGWPNMTSFVRVWDLAATEGGGDFTVGERWGRGEDGRFYLFDVQRFRKAAGDVSEAVVRQAHFDGYLTKILIEEEKGGSGKSVTAFYKKELPGYRVEPAKAEGDKVSRMTPYAGKQNQGQCVLPPPEQAAALGWSTKDFIDEHAKQMSDGRGPRNDDQIDTGAYAILDLVGVTGVDLWLPTQSSDHLSPEAQMRRLLAEPATARMR